MAKFSFILLSVFAVAFVAAQQVVRFTIFNDGSGTYNFTYELDNGQIFSEAGALKEDGSQYVQGSYSYVGPDGESHGYDYSADSEGFHPVIGSASVGPGEDAAINPNALKSLIGSVG